MRKGRAGREVYFFPPGVSVHVDPPRPDAQFCQDHRTGLAAGRAAAHRRHGGDIHGVFLPRHQPDRTGSGRNRGQAHAEKIALLHRRRAGKVAGPRRRVALRQGQPELAGRCRTLLCAGQKAETHADGDHHPGRHAGPHRVLPANLLRDGFGFGGGRRLDQPGGTQPPPLFQDDRHPDPVAQHADLRFAGFHAVAGRG